MPPKRKFPLSPKQLKKLNAKRMAKARTKLSDEQKAVQREKDRLRMQIRRYTFLMMYYIYRSIAIG